MTDFRVHIEQDPFRGYNPQKSWEGIGTWPAQWVELPGAKPPFVAAYRLNFTMPSARTVRAHASADERYELYLDGQRVGRGPERGSPLHWYYETYDLPVAAGEHVLVARVWALGDAAPFAQMTARPGWLFAPDDESLLPLLATGQANWEVKPVGGYRFVRKELNQFFVTGDHCEIDGARVPWGYETGAGGGWVKAVPFDTAVSASTYRLTQAYHELAPASLPAMMEVERRLGRVRFVEAVEQEDTSSRPVDLKNHLNDEAEPWQQAFTGGGALIVPPRTTRRAVIDLEEYCCAYPRIEVSGGRGSTIRLGWAEGLFVEPEFRSKGSRDEIEGKYFNGITDSFLPDGAEGRTFELLWWRAGRYLEVWVQTGEQPLTIHAVTMRETRYPLENESTFAATDPRFAPLEQVAVRALQMCSHETYMDCPYYEQLMYVGDTRLETLVTYAISRDERLPRKALRTFDVSRTRSGLTQSRFPSRVMQVIPPFSLWWVAMAHDYALWRGDPTFTRGLLPGVRAVIEAFAGFRGEDGLIKAPHGWNFMDWSAGWWWGVPPDGDLGANGIINWQAAWVFNQAADLEEWIGDAELSARCRRLSAEIARAATAAFWDEERGLFADTLAHDRYSEHAQVLALLSGHLSEAESARVMQGLLTRPDLTRTTIYFTHYLFEALRQAGRVDKILDRMGLWFEHPVLGMKTTLEQPEPSRSDCHAWGAHPVFHAYATLLGVRPASMGFQTVRIAPLPGPLPRLSGTLVHPNGEIRVSLEQEGETLKADISLPDGVTGEFVYRGKTVTLHPGSQTVEG